MSQIFKILKRAIPGRERLPLLTVIQASMLAYSATRHSPTYLEPAFLASGLMNWEFARFEPYRVNPPLVRMIAALPVLAVAHQSDWSRFSEGPGVRSEFPLGEAFIKANEKRVLDLMVYARWACIPFSLIGAYFAYRWAKELYGPNCGLVTLILYVFDPNLLAHGELITPDAACTAFGILAGYTFWRWLKQPSWARALFAGAALGIAELAKMSWLILFAVWPTLWLVWRLLEPRRAKLSGPIVTRVKASEVLEHSDGGFVGIKPASSMSNAVRPPLVQLVLITLFAIYLINLGYAFEGTLTPLKDFQFVSTALTGLEKPGRPGNRFQSSFIGSIPLPFPKNYILGFDSQKKDFEHFEHRSYLRGTWSDHGWWYYYLYGLLVKVPCGTWGLLVLVIVSRMIQCSRAASVREEFVPLLPAFSLLVLVSSQTEFSIHLRYAFPALGLTLIFLGQAGKYLSQLTPIRATLISVAMLYSTISSLYAYPNHLAYFNDFVGGPQNGRRHLLSSSLDWGQGTGDAVAWLANTKPLSEVQFVMWNELLAQVLAEKSLKIISRGSSGPQSELLILYSADRYYDRQQKSDSTESRRNESVIHYFPSGMVLVSIKPLQKSEG